MTLDILTQEKLRQLLTYDPTTGNFVWLVNRRSKVKAGAIAGYKDANGYTKIQINGQTYSAHRLAWYYVHGVWPPQEIDHINRQRDDNRLCNLRLADKMLNNRNRKTSNKHGVKGVHWHKMFNRWVGQISLNGKNNHLGLYDRFEDAVQARKIAEIILGWP